MSRLDLWMPVYIGDYLGDTMRLNTLQHGAYLLLLFEYWRQGPLPQDHGQLANVAGVYDPKVWSGGVWPALQRYFTVGEDGLLHQKRIDQEREKRLGLSATRSDAAKKKRRGGGGEGGDGGGKPPARGPQKPPGTGGNEAANAIPIAATNAQAHVGADADLFAPSDAPTLGQQEHNLEQTHARTRYNHNHRVEDSVLRTVAPTPPAVDARAELWAYGLPLVRQLLGKSEPASRSILGRFLRDGRDDCPRVLATLRQAADLRPVDPAAWITAALQNRAATGMQGRIDDQYDQLRDWAADTGALQ
jgi:hypothetical protein